MKKSLVLAMAMALGVTVSAYAANPFSDVPAGHWAYDSISKLAAAGVIEGYGDDTFRGDRLMTRYEMAQIVAKAMAKGANVDKLAAEFADELEKLNVRVAALEKKSDNVKITGEIRYHYAPYKFHYVGGGKEKDHEHGLRSRLYITGKINDNWSYVGRIQNQQDFRTDHADETTEFNIAKLEGRLGGVNVVAGRDDDVFADGYIYDGEHDAIKLSYGDKWYISGAYGKLTDLNSGAELGESDVVDGKGNALADWEDGEKLNKKFWNAEIGTNMEGFANFKTGYLKAYARDKELARGAFGREDIGIWYLGTELALNDDLALNAMYLRGSKGEIDGESVDRNGYVAGLSYKGAEASEPGSWGLAFRYYHQGRTTYLAHTIDGYTGFNSGFKGWSFGGDVTLAKNMVLSATYYDTKGLKENLEGISKAKVFWTEFNVTF